MARERRYPNCVTCGVPLTERGQSKHCPECRMKLRSAVAKVKCPVCGRVVKQRKAGGRFIYCSDGCREKAKTCSFPGCDRIALGGSGRCKGHRVLEERPGYRDLYCRWVNEDGKVCGHGPRSTLYIHVINCHQGCAAYREQFGPDSLESDGVMRNRKTRWAARLDQGIVRLPPRQRVCKKGHRLAGHNVIIKPRTGRRSGEFKRECRKCFMAKQKEYRLNRRNRRRQETPTEATGKCLQCGSSFVPKRKNHYFCCRECRWAWWA